MPMFMPSSFSHLFSRLPCACLFLCLTLLFLSACDHEKEKTPSDSRSSRWHLRVNCGGSTHKDEDAGVVWASDKQYAKAGRKYRFRNEPSIKSKNAPPVEVYRTARRARIHYHFKDVQDGVYLLRLHFMDDPKKHERRSMQFWFENQLYIQNFNVKEAAGHARKPVVTETLVAVNDGNGLQVKGSPGRGDDVFISAIEILEAPRDSQPDQPLVEIVPSNIAAALKEFTQLPVRVVWTRTEHEEDYYQNDADGVLMGMDTEGGSEETVILPGPRSYAMPMITPDGEQVVFTDKTVGKCFVVGFDGQGLREITSGFASDVWQDPASKIVWVYVRKGLHEVNSPVVRVNLASPNQAETVWKQSASGIRDASWFTVSPDGKFASDTFPWPRCGLADLEDGDVTLMGKGCWPSLSPDGSGRYFHFMGNHTTLELFDPAQSQPRQVKLSTVPGWTGRKVYHPRWTNHPRFITATAPQWMPETELYVGRFDSSYTEIEAWFRVTYNQSSDFFGDVWFYDRAPTLSTTETSAFKNKAPLVSQSSPLPQKGLVFIWENDRAKNAVLQENGKVKQAWSIRYDGQARPNRWFGADIRQGGIIPGAGALEAVVSAIQQSEAFTITLDARASTKNDASARPGVLLYLGDDAQQNVPLSLEQNGTSLTINMQTDAASTMSVSWNATPAEESQSIALRYEAGKLSLYVNGQQRAAGSGTPDLEEWQAEHLRFGSAPSGKNPWAGLMENIRIYGRALSPEEIRHISDASMLEQKSRKVPDPILIEAELLQASEVADPQLIAPYSRSLTENHYRVKTVIRGEVEAQELIVLQWGILGGEILPTQEREEGQVYRLTLEPETEHAQLSGEHRSTDLLEAGLPVYYDIRS